MADVEFEDDYASSAATLPSSTRSRGLTGRMVAWGLAKDERGATMLALGIAITILLVSGILWWFSIPHAGAPLSNTEKAREFQAANPSVPIPQFGK